MVKLHHEEGAPACYGRQPDSHPLVLPQAKLHILALLLAIRRLAVQYCASAALANIWIALKACRVQLMSDTVC